MTSLRFTSLRSLSLGAAALLSSTALSLAQAPAPTPAPAPSPSAPASPAPMAPTSPAAPAAPRTEATRPAGTASAGHAERLAAIRGVTLTLSQAIDAAERAGQGTGQAQGQAPMQGQASVQGQPPMQGQAPMQGQTTATGPTTVPGQAPMPGQTTAAGQPTAPGQTAGQLQAQAPAQGQIPSPVQGQGQAQARAISAEFERAEGNSPARYEVKVVHADGRLVEHEVDAMNGRILKSENQPFERFFTRLKPADLASAPTSLRRAIELAEERAGPGSRAVDAEVEREGSTVAYEIEVATPDRMREVKVRADGQVTLD